MFEIVNGWTPKHGYTISSPGEPEGSGELIMKHVMKNCLNFTYALADICVRFYLENNVSHPCLCQSFSNKLHAEWR